MKMSNKVYNVLKWVCLIGLPALGGLYFGLSKLWGLPYGEEILGTLDLLATFIGACIGISTKNYRKGVQDGETNV